MFMGEYQHTIDSKNRLIIPAKFREQLGDVFVATKGLDKCLFVYPINEWNLIEEKLKAMPMTRGDARSFVRFFMAGASDCELVIVPPNLREYALLEKDVVIIGVSSRLEIWNAELWKAYCEKAEESFADIAENLTDLNL